VHSGFSWIPELSDGEWRPQPDKTLKFLLLSENMEENRTFCRSCRAMSKYRLDHVAEQTFQTGIIELYEELDGRYLVHPLQRFVCGVTESTELCLTKQPDRTFHQRVSNPSNYVVIEGNGGPEVSSME
jgi:hypothetical protein